MGENSAIEWTDHTFNPWRGCVEVHAGCDHCYAREMSKRNPSTLGVWGGDHSDGGIRVVAAEKNWTDPLKWNDRARLEGRRDRVFCASLADVFEDWRGPMLNAHDEQLCMCRGCGEFLLYTAGHRCDSPLSDRVPSRLTMDHVRRRLFQLIDATPNLDWILVTKRPENIRWMWPSLGFAGTCERCGKPVDFNLPCGMLGGLCPCGERVAGGGQGPGGCYRKNVWLLTSVSDQATADRMIPELLTCRDLAPVLGISAEPLLGPIDFTLRGDRVKGWDEDWKYDVLSGEEWAGRGDAIAGSAHLDWVIVGGESGPHARPMHPDWARSIRNQCLAASVPLFFKQWGEYGAGSVNDVTGEPVFRQFHNERQWLNKAPTWVNGGVCLDADGRELKRGSDFDIAAYPITIVHRLGKKKTGRALDGILHSEFPRTEAVA